MLPNFSWAIFTLFAWLVPHVSIEIGEYRRSIDASPFWTAYGGGDKGGTSERYEKAIKHARRSAIAAIVTAVLLIIGTAAGVAATTGGLNPNMDSIIKGGSLFMASVVTGILSVKSPRWIGIYYSRKWIKFQSVGRNTRMLGFNVYWSVSKQFAKAYFCLLPFYIGSGPAKIPLSAITGILAGFAIDAAVHFSRHRVKDDVGGGKRGFGLAFVLLVASAAFFAHGCYFVDTVWGRDRWVGRYAQLRVITGTVWFFLGVLIHGLIWWKTQKRMVAQEDSSSDAEGGSMRLSAEHTPGTRDRLAMSLIKSKIKKSKAGGDASSSTAAGIGATSLTDKSSERSVGESQATKEGGGGDDGANGSGAQQQEFVDDITDDSNPLGRSGKEKPFFVEEDPDPSWFSLLAGKICCRSSPDQDEITTCEKIIAALEVMLWASIAGGFLFVVIVNIGAQAQVASTNALLPGVKVILYNGMNEGEVCAFDDRGPESDIRTFPTKEDAHASGYKVLHCGNCGYCSTWENLRREWSTRNYLAEESARCARKSLSGGRQAVLDCLQLDPLGFDYKCADCWTTDILCTKDHCAFIFLQSQFINTAGNFAVGPDEITSATCEEAHCEVDPFPGVPGFVRCSGATRRRMNIKSTIARPISQQCTIVDVDWTDLFGPCCQNTAEYAVDLAERERLSEQ